MTTSRLYTHLQLVDFSSHSSDTRLPSLSIKNQKDFAKSSHLLPPFVLISSWVSSYLSFRSFVAVSAFQQCINRNQGISGFLRKFEILLNEGPFCPSTPLSTLAVPSSRVTNRSRQGKERQSFWFAKRLLAERGRKRNLDSRVLLFPHLDQQHETAPREIACSRSIHLLHLRVNPLSLEPILQLQVSLLHRREPCRTLHLSRALLQLNHHLTDQLLLLPYP